MSRGIPFGSVGGVRLVVGLSWLVMLPLISVAIFAGIEPETGSTSTRLVVATGGSLLLWVSVVVHELGHAAAARRHGVDVRRVVVLLAGGYSEMDLDTARPDQEWAVAIAGPISSGLLGAVLAVAAVAAPATAGLDSTLMLLAVINGGVAAFNLLPAFPLDGGRMLRSVLVRRGHSPIGAERSATRVGFVLGGGIAVVGIGMSIAGSAASLVMVPGGVLLLGLAVAAARRSPSQEPAEEI